MTADRKILTYDFYGKPARFKRENLISLCTTYEVSAMMRSVKDDSEHTGLVTYVEDGFKGFKDRTDAALSKHWSDIREDYVAMLKNEDLVFEDDISYDMITDKDEKAEAIKKLERMHRDQQYASNIIPVTLQDWQEDDEIGPGAPKQIEAFIEISSDRITLTEGDFRDADVLPDKRSVGIELENGDLRVLSFAKNHEAPMKTRIPREGLITNDDHDYLIESSAADVTGDVLKGPGQ